MADIMKCPECNNWYDINHPDSCKNGLFKEMSRNFEKQLDEEIAQLDKIIKAKKEINMWILTDEFGRIYYQGSSEESVNDYKESNGFKERFVVKLTGYLPGEK
jgi:hypothetical protein